MSYGTSITDAYRQTAFTPGGFSKARNRPTYRSCGPTNFEFVINLKTAKALGLAIPPTLLVAADEVID